MTAVEKVPAVYALFQRRIAGDEALLKLARLRFAQAGLAAEVYAGSPGDLEEVLRFAPHAAAAPFVHLDRGIDLRSTAGQDAVADIAASAAGRVRGLVVHDRTGMAERPQECRSALAGLAGRLGDGRIRPRLYLEYAAGAPLEAFAELAAALAGLDTISVCLDVGHIGVAQARRAFARRHPALDVAALRPRDPRLPEIVGDVQAAVHTALPALLDVIGAVGALGKPVHFHLHDGHPLIPGLSDHVSFLSSVPVPFDVDGRRALDPMYGPAGLAAIVGTALAACTDPTLTLEIHQVEGRLPLHDAADLFTRWTDTTNAERMNYWLAVLAENAALLRGLHRLGDAGLPAGSLPAGGSAPS